jgi:uncharacterized protein (UPF0262 family)
MTEASAAAPTEASRESIATIVLDEGSIIRRTPEVDHERAVAIADLLEANHFAPHGLNQGPYDVFLSVADNRLTFTIYGEGRLQETLPSGELLRTVLPLQPLRAVIKDYFLICESYFDAIRHAPPSRIEAIDMARRGLHNEGSEQLRDLLDGKIAIDFETSRRLFTLICVLHIR